MGNLTGKTKRKKEVILDITKQKFNTNVVTIGKSVSTSIYQSIIKEANSVCNDGFSFPVEIVMQCMKYLGFVMNSTILNDMEKYSLHQLLIDHHLRNTIKSSLLDVKNIAYFDILYRKSSNDNHSNYRMLLSCVDKPNIIMVFHTEYNHVFCVYFRNPLRWFKRRWIRSENDNDDKSALFLLRRQHIYGDKICPREIKVESTDRPKYRIFKSGFYAPNKMNMGFMGISLIEESDDKEITESVLKEHHVLLGWRLDSLGNEICGGETFDDSKTTEYTGNDGNATKYPFLLKDIEIYQIL